MDKPPKKHDEYLVHGTICIFTGKYVGATMTSNEETPLYLFAYEREDEEGTIWAHLSQVSEIKEVK